MEEEFAYAIETVSDQLGIAVEHIYDVFVDAQLVIGITTIISLAVSLLAGAIFAKLFYKLLKSYLTDDDGDWDNNESPVVAAAFSVMATMVFLVLCVCLTRVVEDALLKIFCPEYTAIREILLLVMGG